MYAIVGKNSPVFLLKSMKADFRFRDALALAIVKSRYDCKQESKLWQARGKEWEVAHKKAEAGRQELLHTVHQQELTNQQLTDQVGSLRVALQQQEEVLFAADRVQEHLKHSDQAPLKELDRGTSVTGADCMSKAQAFKEGSMMEQTPPEVANASLTIRQLSTKDNIATNIDLQCIIQSMSLIQFRCA